MRYTRETYEKHLQELLPESDFTLNSFTGTEKPCSITCHKCGSTYDFSAAALIARRAQRNCKNVCKKCENNIWTTKQHEAEIKGKYKLKQKQTIIPLEEIKTWGSHEKIEWQCLKCGHTFKRSPQLMFAMNILSCPWCETHPFIYTKEIIEEKAKEVWGNDYSVLNSDNGKNSNGSKRILVCHNKCGFKYSVDLWKFLHGSGCPRCKESKGEYKVRKYLENHNFKYQEQYRIYYENSWLRFDFYLEENNKKYAIEYNGIQHYQKVEYFNGEKGFIQQQKCDDKKKRYCIENNIELIIIPYYNESLINSEKLAQRLSGQATE